MHVYLEPSVLVGRIATRFEVVSPGNDRIEITMKDGKRYAFFHSQDCCETVSIHDTKGKLEHLVGSKFKVASLSAENKWPDDVPKGEYHRDDDSFTWTTLDFQTAKGTVRIRWLGESNGYYGEGVDFEELKP